MYVVWPASGLSRGLGVGGVCVMTVIQTARPRRSAKQVRQPTLDVRLDFVGSAWRVTGCLLVV